jgi:Flp pilus assembly protein TadG
MTTKNGRKKNERGAILIMMALFLVMLLAFAGVGMEGGRWFLVRAELSKTVDAAALVAAANISNPRVTPQQLVADFAAENFPTGFLSSPITGGGAPVFTTTITNGNLVKVDGHVSAIAIFSRVLGFDLIPVSSTGVAQQRRVEIMLVLDRSTSMLDNGGITGVKAGANAFVDFFATTQADDKLGLVSYATGVKVDCPLANNFAGAMHTAINAMQANGWTNAEDGIAQSGGPDGFTPQGGVAPADRVPQFLVFFTDGRANSFRSTFVKGNTTYDAVAQQSSNCDPGDQNHGLQNTLFDPATGNQIGGASNPIPTGDGLPAGSACGAGTNTHWVIMDTYPINGHPFPYCGIPENSVVSPYVCGMAETLALQNAQALKAAGVTVYSIGLGALIHEDFLKQIASSPALYYLAPTANDLKAIFQHIALDIKLRLVL